VAILDAVAGVQAQTETVWRQSDKYNVPKIAFINKYDREGSSMSRTMSMMSERLKATPLPLQIPVGRGVGFRGVVDLIRMQIVFWPESDGKKMEVKEVQGSEFEEVAKEKRQELLENLCELDEDFLEMYLNNPEKCQDVSFINAAIRRATSKFPFFFFLFFLGV
jgi:elongation factor G